MDFDCESLTMEIKPLTREQIARNEKKMNMTLDDIIRMSRKAISRSRKPSALNKSQRFSTTSIAERDTTNARRFMDSKSSVRQGVLAQRRSNIQANQFHLAISNAIKSAATPICSRPMSRDMSVLPERRSNVQSNRFDLQFANAMTCTAVPMRTSPLNRDRIAIWDKSRVQKTLVQRKTSSGDFHEQEHQQGKMKVVEKKHDVARTRNYLSAYVKKKTVQVITQQNNSPRRFQRRVTVQHQQHERGLSATTWQTKSGINVFV